MILEKDDNPLPRAWVYEIKPGLLDGNAKILTLTIYDRHPDKGGKQLDGGYYGGIGVAVRDCGFKRYWSGYRTITGKENCAEFIFGESGDSWAETEPRRFPPEFYEFRPPDDWVFRGKWPLLEV
jgi:hypothetical protein